MSACVRGAPRKDQTVQHVYRKRFSTFLSHEYVGGFSHHLRTRSLSMSQIADHEGTVSRAQLVKTRLKQADSDKSAINAYIVFVSVDSARAALVLNGKEVGGRHIRVDVASDAKKHDHTRSGNKLVLQKIQIDFHLRLAKPHI